MPWDMNERDLRRSESFMGIFALLKKKVSEGSISSEKLGRGLSDTLFNVDSETLSGNRIFNIEILMSLFSILSCPVCYNQELYLIEDSRLGLQSNLCLKCKNCSFTKGFTSTSKGNNLNIINLFVFGMRIIGKGFSAGKKLFSMLNIPYPSKCTYRQHELKLLHAASQAANNSMLESAKSIAECSNECGVSVDDCSHCCIFSLLLHRQKTHDGQCPSGSDTWCKYQKVKQEGKLYKHRTAGLPNAVLNTVKTTYMDLCDQSLLEKCLHGKTQNAIESFNGVLWSIIPKGTFVELLTLQFRAFLAVLQFNDGSKGIISVLEYLHIPMGYFILKGFSKVNDERIVDSERDS
ncbi:uncharacterized protein TNCV_1730671 [Trichonephila clavipes]|nr:uncharacterized protein TNCV_1730671 [Trichonephila clavipes]